MPYISVKTDDNGGLRTLHERVTPSDFDNELFCLHLVERLSWAVEDARRVRDSSPSLLASKENQTRAKETVGFA